MPDTNNLPYEESNRRFYRKLAELRAIETKTKCDQFNFDPAADALVAQVRERASLPFAIQVCEKFARAVKALWEAADPKECESLYERSLERSAFETVLSRHNIPLEEVEEAKNLIDARVTETLT